MAANREHQLQVGVSLFNAQKFYAAHEAWEKWWLVDKSAERSFFQGLIILAGGFHHLQKGRTGPGEKAIKKALEKLSSYPEEYLGVGVGDLRRAVKAWQESTRNKFPKINYC